MDDVSLRRAIYIFMNGLGVEIKLGLFMASANSGITFLTLTPFYFPFFL